MAAAPARAAAFQILLRIERDHSYASELLHSDALSKLSTRDHGLATELVMGVLRWRSMLDESVGAASSQKLERLDPEVLTALRVAAYQLLFLSKVPARAAIFESVELVKAAKKKSAAPFVNAVLRKISTRKFENPIAAIEACSDVPALARSSAHPEWLIARWVKRYGLVTVQKLCTHNQSVPVTAISVRGEVPEEEFAAGNMKVRPGAIISSARRVLTGDLGQMKAYRDGRIYVQDEASQLVAMLATSGQVDSSAILDCCAAPGSKTSLMAYRNPHSRVLATEIHPHRARLLKKLNRANNVSIVVADARALPFTLSFDRILADVPCSGTGTLAHNPEIKWRLKPDDLEDLQSRQVGILRSAMQQLSVGGRVLYSTCSLESEENEDVVKVACAGSPDFSVIDIKPELDRLGAAAELSATTTKTLPPLVEGQYLRTIPGTHPCDGFFAALLERKV